MATAQSRSKRKPTGGRYVPMRTKRLRELARLPTLTRVGERLIKTLRKRGGKTKTISVTDTTANIFDPKTKKYSKVKIEQVIENPANRHFVRRNILTRGTIIKTSKGNAKILSRPGQEGVVNAIFVK
ncbi:30S ribosomal protein S8e [Candidatus Woesearchaeota archaeon]|jgi:small subunit ribosomal protein S8e|nr:30S ribosomal protein S8e [Candidatus Woesearchaeota archaeon]MBT6044657.1 30S ribosomal protein S8e [Candidatus Woesearchaeota archaeon]